jgi:hypothetical protein
MKKAVADKSGEGHELTAADFEHMRPLVARIETSAACL